jgi:flagellar hook-associated protein 3 FlgL
MRISDRQSARNFLKYLDNAKSNLAETNLRVASGARFTKISDDVSAGTKALRASMEKAKTQEYYNNVKAVGEQLSTTEDALSAINDILSDAHTKVLSALNDPSSESGREALSNLIGSLRDEIVQFANTKYNDKFVLGGTGASTAPFSVSSGGKLLYNGIDIDSIQRDTAGFFYMDGGVRKDIPMDGDTYVDIGLGIKLVSGKVQTGTAMKTSYSGLEILGFGTDADGKTNNIFNILTQLKDSIAAADTETMGAYDTKLLNATTLFRGHLTDIGSKTSFLDTIEKRINTKIDNYDSQTKRLVGINDAEEATRQTMNDYVLKAVLSMGADIIPVSLMDFLR